MRYQLLPAHPNGEAATSIKRFADDGSVAFVPMSDGNSDYEEYKLWRAAGNTPLPAE